MNYYPGSSRKFPIDMDGARYMVKPAGSGRPRTGDPDSPSASPTAASPIAEYLGCHVFETAGIPLRVEAVVTPGASLAYLP